MPVIGAGGNTVNVAGQASMQVTALIGPNTVNIAAQASKQVVAPVSRVVTSYIGDTRYYEDSVAVQPWVQADADFGVSSAVTAHGHVTRIDNYYAQATVTFTSAVDVVTPGTGAPQFFIRDVFRSLDPGFAGWYWGWSTPDSRCSVHGQIGGLPFVGFVDRGGSLLDVDGNTLSRVLVTGDYLIGTVTGVFQND
jgi:hypothetical protein